MNSNIPTIKGVFVLSHITSLKKVKGNSGVKKLEKNFGKPLNYKPMDNVPIRDEVHLIECAVGILSNKPLSNRQISYEAGKLHFRNFMTTPFARIVIPFFKNQFKLVMMQSQNIAGHVLRGVDFQSYDLGGKKVKIIMRNYDYPIDHFRGLFQEWMEYSGLKGTVSAKKIDRMYEYVMKWK